MIFFYLLAMNQVVQRLHKGKVNNLTRLTMISLRKALHYFQNLVVTNNNLHQQLKISTNQNKICKRKQRK